MLSLHEERTIRTVVAHLRAAANLNPPAFSMYNGADWRQVLDCADRLEKLLLDTDDDT